MQHSERAAQARRELDRKFSAADLRPIQARPRSGWIRAIREALDMSQVVLARRLEINRGSVNKLEHAEPRGGITIGKLEEVAAALDCTLVYALIPRSTLEQTVLDQARAVAVETFRYAARTMELEDQAVSSDRLREIVEREAQELVRKGNVWGTP
jgi:predicted DNA-binding mobile mystery protein A